MNDQLKEKLKNYLIDVLGFSEEETQDYTFKDLDKDQQIECLEYIK